MSVASNLVPAIMVELVNAALAGDWAKAEAINAKMHGFFKALFIEPNPVPAKTAMKMAGLIKDDFVRLPLCHMRAENVEILKREMINAGIL